MANYGPMKPNHPLSKWIEGRMPDFEFARLAGISKSHLSLILNGKRRPSLELAIKIEKITRGEFPPARLLRDTVAQDARAAR